jgi:hypothetical protein
MNRGRFRSDVDLRDFHLADSQFDGNAGGQSRGQLRASPPFFGVFPHLAVVRELSSAWT